MYSPPYLSYIQNRCLKDKSNSSPEFSVFNGKETMMLDRFDLVSFFMAYQPSEVI